MRLEQVRLYVLLSEGIAALPLVEAAAAAIAGGADAVQLRLKRSADRDFLALARELRRLTRERDVFFVVNDRPDIAILAEADAVHLGQDDLPPREVRRMLPRAMRMGVSTHSVEQALAAAAAGADHIGFGPIRPTATRGYEEGQGMARLADVARATRAPIVAIGGITAEDVPAARDAGASAVAVCRAALAAPDIAAATRRIKDAFGEEGK